MTCLSRWYLTLLGALAFVPSAAAARDTLGVYGVWAAFQDVKPARCFAISEPDMSIAPVNPRWRAFFAVADWPARRASGQVHMRLSKPRKPGTALRLMVGTEKFELVSAGSEAWAQDARTDAAILKALRSFRRATVTGVARDGTAIRDGYSLEGAASALDAVRLGCARS